MCWINKYFYKIKMTCFLKSIKNYIRWYPKIVSLLMNFFFFSIAGMFLSLIFLLYVSNWTILSSVCCCGELPEFLTLLFINIVAVNINNVLLELLYNTPRQLEDILFVKIDANVYGWLIFDEYIFQPIFIFAGFIVILLLWIIRYKCNLLWSIVLIRFHTLAIFFIAIYFITNFLAHKFFVIYIILPDNKEVLIDDWVPLCLCGFFIFLSEYLFEHFALQRRYFIAYFFAFTWCAFFSVLLYFFIALIAINTFEIDLISFIRFNNFQAGAYRYWTTEELFQKLIAILNSDPLPLSISDKKAMIVVEKCRGSMDCLRREAKVLLDAHSYRIYITLWPWDDVALNMCFVLIWGVVLLYFGLGGQ